MHTCPHIRPALSFAASWRGPTHQRSHVYAAPLLCSLIPACCCYNTPSPSHRRRNPRNLEGFPRSEPLLRIALLPRASHCAATQASRTVPQNVIRDAVTYAEHARRKVCVALLSPSPPPAKSIKTAPARVLLSQYLPLSNVPTLAQTVTNLDVVYVSLSIYQTNAQPPPCHTILCLRPCHWRPSQSTCRLLAGTAAARKDVVRCAVGTCALVPQSCIHFPANIAARLWRLKRDDLPDKGW